MRNSLADAVSELGLEPGQFFQATVSGCEVQIHRPAEPRAPLTVLPPQHEPLSEEPSQFADRVMLDPWFETPPPQHVITVKAKFGPGPRPDPPIIPPEFEVTE